MSTQSMTNQDAHAHGHEHHEHEHHDPVATRVFGFWIYIMSDCVLFASIFATFAVLSTNYAGGPTSQELFELPFVLVETFVLLASSFMIGLSTLAMNKGNKQGTMLWLALTLLLGIVFVSLEIYEFHHFIAEGAGPQRSAFLSSFFTLVGTHGLHVTSGCLWAIVLLIQIATKGLTDMNRSRLMCLSLFWHFLHIIWICVFTIVYLMGAM
ncbi:cytochrome o ubiquinol oxidase subunit III [Kushneria konosiri]|uniref:Cytochrome bo(3) ubiquinol oxidase subunit 3 n=1 Tax=Kushneria konosiri TaxID=698828 RepID=A0A2Z2H9V7_9GAMM|nr:cytochrome o ubiquinol oxidase subunit III [Kushneria konosiri]ARS52110.1 cytochrome o ubiquinol oxidase subunit III [Kushneria konosiri]